MRTLLVALVGLWLAAAGARAQAQGAGTEPGWHGLTAETVTPEVMAARKLVVPFGALVTAVEPGSPAAGVDIKAGDVVISIGTTQVPDAAALTTQLDKLAAGAEARLTRMRGGQAETVALRLAARPRVLEPVTAGAAPRLMLDTGGHQSIIKGLAWTPDGKQIVSAGNDKVIRVWDAETGRTLRTIRGEADAGDAGKIYAMALSPDGRWLAVGGG